MREGGKKGGTQTDRWTDTLKAPELKVLGQERLRIKIHCTGLSPPPYHA